MFFSGLIIILLSIAISYYTLFLFFRHGGAAVSSAGSGNWRISRVGQEAVRIVQIRRFLWNQESRYDRMFLDKARSSAITRENAGREAI